MELSAKELVYAVATLGVKHFWGITDPFFGESPKEVKKDCLILQKQLVEKGLARMGFENSFRLTEEFKKTVENCCFCEQILGMEIFGGSQKPVQLLCYKKESSLELLLYSGKNIQLEAVAADGLLKKYEEALAWENCAENAQVKGMVTVKLLEEAKTRENAEAASTFLVEKGATKEIGEIIGETIIGRVRTIRIYRHDVEGRTRDAVQLLWTEKGALVISEDSMASEETWILQTITKEEVLLEIKQRCEEFLGKPEGMV